MLVLFMVKLIVRRISSGEACQRSIQCVLPFFLLYLDNLNTDIHYIKYAACCLMWKVAGSIPDGVTGIFQ
jgi:hypothetical protein